MRHSILIAADFFTNSYLIPSEINVFLEGIFCVLMTSIIINSSHCYFSN